MADTLSPAPAVVLQESRFAIPGMDCAAEERLVRMALAPLTAVQALEFDLAARRLRVVHGEDPGVVLERLAALGFGARLEASRPLPDVGGATATVRPGDTAPAASAGACKDKDKGGDNSAGQGEGKDAGERREAATLRLLLGINAVMFLVELLAGWLAESTGLLADSLDMLADAAVYGIALYAVRRGAARQLQAAHAAGWLQLALAMGALVEVGRRAVFGSEPESGLMLGIALLALIANTACLWLVSRQRDRGAHMKASWIFSANDVLANLGVIVAGALVAWTGSAWPDLVIGTLIGLVVLNGARRILAIRA